jgi:plastocyanin
MRAMGAGGGTWPRVLVGALIASIVFLVLVMAVNKFIIPPVAVICVVFAALAYSVYRWPRKRWLLIVATVLVVLAVAGNVPFVVEDLQHPESGWVFIPTLLSMVAGVVGIVAAIAAVVRATEAPARPLVFGAAGLSAVLVAVSLVATLQVEDDEQQDGDIVVVAEGVEYPETLAAQAGAIGLFIENKDLVRHTFVIDAEDVKQEVPSSTNRRLEVTLEAGTYEYYCDVPGHEEAMKGTLEGGP